MRRTLGFEVVVTPGSGYSQQDVQPRFVGEGLTGILQKPRRLAALRNDREGRL
jgi:hypothetical protein